MSLKLKACSYGAWLSWILNCQCPGFEWQCWPTVNILRDNCSVLVQNDNKMKELPNWSRLLTVFLKSICRCFISVTPFYNLLKRILFRLLLHHCTALLLQISLLSTYSRNSSCTVVIFLIYDLDLLLTFWNEHMKITKSCFWRQISPLWIMNQRESYLIQSCVDSV